MRIVPLSGIPVDVGDTYENLAVLLNLTGVRLAILEAVLNFQTSGITVQYRPDGTAPGGSDAGTKYTADSFLGLARAERPETAFQLSGFWVRETSAGGGGKIAVQGVAVEWR